MLPAVWMMDASPRLMIPLQKLQRGERCLIGVAFAWSGAALLVVAIVFWLISLVRNDVSIVDSLWSLMFLLVAHGLRRDERYGWAA